MRRARFDFEKKRTLFQQPKYSGVTLSLLSIFVLVCMLAVWEKMPPSEKPISLSGIAWEECRTPIEKTKVEYEKATNVLVKIDYLPKLELFKRLQDDSKENKPRASFAIFPVNAWSKGQMAGKDWKERIIIAHRSDDGENKENDLSLIGSVHNDCDTGPLALGFIRFLSAPSRGQFYFAQAKWSGVRGDKWSLSTKLQILAPFKMKGLIMQTAREFESREGIGAEVQFLDPNQILQVLLVTSKSKGKEFLPDLTWVTAGASDAQIKKLTSIESTMPAHSANCEYQGYVSKWSHFPQSARRFNNYMMKNLSE